MKIFQALPGAVAGATLAVAVATLATACGSQVATGSGGTGHAHAAVSLSISVTAARGDRPRRWTLTCDPAGGTHPDPAAACRALEHARDPFAPVPRGVMCPMIDSGPQTATITGTWRGKRVSASYARENGCQTERWDKIGQVLDGINPGGPMLPASGGSSPAG